MEVRCAAFVKRRSSGWGALSPETPVVYYPQPLDAPGATVLVHTQSSSNEAEASIERQLASVDSSAVRGSHTIEASLALQLYPFDIAYWVASLLGGIALLLTLTGVYGVVAYVVAQRTRELGVRMALGADPLMLIMMVMRQLARLAVAGLGAGLLLALIATRLLSAVSYVVALDDPTGYVIGVAVVLSACLLAAFVPARRAGRVDPALALRADA
jgi:ABC-type antimicrobial peptide transport system permease subunit